MENLPAKSSSAPGFSYDETPYPSSSFPESHPDKLCAMGRLFGINATPPTTARILELGCADGANLLPMAQHAPTASFLGIDASSKNVATANETILAAGLRNVEIRHMDLVQFPSSEGKFDYIIAHGLFSWVDETVRLKILSICRDHLSENGVAYISYNALPGWSMRLGLREMMLFHTSQFTDGKTKVAQARALTAFLADSVPAEGNPYGMLLKHELQRMASQPDGYIRHDVLGETNEPMYFHQFVQLAMDAGLQYVSEPTLDQMLTSNFPEKVSQTLQQITNNIIAKEQYMDFLRNRSFRRTLLCHREAQLDRNITPNSIKSFYYTSIIAAPETKPIDLKSGVNVGFRLRTGGDVAINVDNSFLKAAFSILAECGLNRISFSELLSGAREKSTNSSEWSDRPDREELEETSLATNLLSLYTRGLVDIYADRPSFRTTVPERPFVTPLVRHQATHARVVTNLAHVAVPVDLIGRYVLAACDGQRDQKALVEHLMALSKEGKLQVGENEAPVSDETRMRAIFTDQVARLIPQIVALGFVRP